MSARGKSVVLVLVALFAGSSRGLAAGTVSSVQFPSAALGEDRWVQVYLPEGYDPGGSIDYPAIYFLHGANGNHSGYPELINHLNNLIDTEQIRPVVVIKPDGSGCPWPPNWEGCGWVDSELQGSYESFLVEDVISWAESTYRIISDPGARGIMGHSMGGFGCMHAALKHPEMFAGVAALSGYPHFEELRNQHVPVILNENSGPPYAYSPNGVFTGAWFMFSGGFSPNLEDPPDYIDFPLGQDGVIIPEVWARWLEHDPAALALALTPETAPAIYFDCGTSDPFLLSPINDAFDALLTSLAIPHEYYRWTGGHWSPGRLAVGLRFLDAAFELEEAGVPAVDAGVRIASLDVPNPMRGRVEIGFETTRPGAASLRVFDLLGRLTATIMDRNLNAGIHRVAWSADDLTGGMYFFQLRAGGDKETRVVVVK